MSKFTVVMSVYISDSPVYFVDAVNSLLNQTRLPDEIIIMVDGPVDNNLNEVIEMYASNAYIKIIRLKENIGLALSRKKAIKHATNEVIAVMDSDDVSVSNRFEKQLPLIVNENAGVVGGWIEEFVNEPRDKGKVRKTPINHKEIFSFGKWRNPINHVTLMFTKEAYDSVDGYSSVRHSEDWDMISRMLIKGIIIKNIPEVLVHVRAGDEMIQRRRDISQLKGEMKLFIKMYRIGYINFMHLFGNIFIRVILRSLPKFITKFTYNSFLRK